MATNYNYDTVTSNDIKLHFIKTSPKNVRPTFLDLEYISNTNYYSVNGGYFDTGTTNILRIAVVNDILVGAPLGTKMLAGLTITVLVANWYGIMPRVNILSK